MACLVQAFPRSGSACGRGLEPLGQIGHWEGKQEAQESLGSFGQTLGRSKPLLAPVILSHPSQGRCSQAVVLFVHRRIELQGT